MLRFLNCSVDVFKVETSPVHDGVGFKNFVYCLDKQKDAIVAFFPKGACTIRRRNTWHREKGTYMIHKEKVYMSIGDPIYYA